MAFIKQTLWLSLRMAKVSLTAGNCNTCGLLKRRREYFHSLGKRCLHETSFIWNTWGKAERGEMFVKKLRARALETDSLNFNPDPLNYHPGQHKQILTSLLTDPHL
jgi:hypothetical protein